jgi:histidinol-phosphate aminotransferase
VAALANTDAMLQMVAEIRDQRDRLLVELPKLGYPVHESLANFVLFGSVAEPQRMFNELLAHDILVRDVGIPHHLRVTAGTAEETTAFLSALATISQ